MSRCVFMGLITLSLALTSCHRDSENQYVIYHTADQKPLVTIIPVINNTKNDQYTWSLSEEFTSSIYSHLEQGPLSLHALSKVLMSMKKWKDFYNPFWINIEWMKHVFEREQFVVFLELVQHEEILKDEHDPKMCSADLNMSMRVRVFDLRGEEPKVVLQEIINDSHFIPRQFTHINFQQVPWNDESFSFSPLGLAHLEFTLEISKRIEDYILLATTPRRE